MKMADAKQKRNEQLKRWIGSETDLEPPVVKRQKTKVKFDDGAVFLAACSSGDTDEVLKLLHRGADINYANVDGLTALHQACIDDNVDMVKFLVENGANINQPDNEGWIPLHAAASCGYLDIAEICEGQAYEMTADGEAGPLVCLTLNTPRHHSLLFENPIFAFQSGLKTNISPESLQAFKLG